ncbi:MAG: hypothetical protein HC914_15715 [Chloroflexaceae bacterium]|nr:hypothetical protein [Chloroflexaceae bacterium]
MNHYEVIHLLESQHTSIRDDVVAATMNNPFWRERFGEEVYQKIIFDTEHNLATLMKAIRYQSPMILSDYILWLRKTLVDLRCSTGMVRETFFYIWNAVAHNLPADAHTMIYQYIQLATQKLNYSKELTTQLGVAHEKLAEALTRQTYDAHWHWQMAYGPDGRAQLRHDTWLCIDYLIDAVGMMDEHIMSRHMRWMRERAVQRGLTTVHVQHFLWFMSTVIESQLPAHTIGEAQRILQASSFALMYEEPAYQALLEAQNALVGNVVHRLGTSAGSARPDQLAMEVGWYVAYLGETLVHPNTNRLSIYSQWLKQHLSMPAATLNAHYSALLEALAQHLPTDTARQAAKLVQAAQRVAQ